MSEGGPDDGVRRSGQDPFAAPPGERDPARRLRGRLPAPVTVWTARAPDGRPTGLTVSSMLVAEGDPPSLLGLVGPLTDFWEAASVSRTFVVHVLASDQVRIADQFAGRYPIDPFDGLKVEESDFGPVLGDVPTRAFCSVDAGGSSPAGYFLLVSGRIARADFATPPSPLVAYRGRYLTVDRRS
jgi:3-hydroxy-9,10-secoandrosta-1,3,5(10)-triene-9,17-dione monooxygenase reductase component